jgi:hypothetical protein
MSAEDRARVTALGGRARGPLAADTQAAISRAGAAAVNSPAGLARRIVKAWPGLSEQERAEVRGILAELG